MTYKRVPVYIQGVKEREQYINEYIHPALVEQGFLDIHIMYDVDKNGPLWNFNRVVDHAVDSGHPYCIVLQDDVILASNFSKHIDDIMSHNIPAVSFFCPPRQKYIDEQQMGTRIYTEKEFLWMQGMLFNIEFLKGFQEYRHTDKESFSCDSIMKSYTKKTKNYIRVVIPSIVQHNLDIKSSIGTGKKIGGFLRESPVFFEVKPPYFR
jgi:hypothetical protein